MRTPGFYVIVWEDSENNRPFVYWGWHLSKENAYKHAYKGMDSYPEFHFNRGVMEIRLSLLMIFDGIFRDKHYGKMANIK